MPGYPRVDRNNDTLIARFDGAVIDAKPWGEGARGPLPVPSSLRYAESTSRLHQLQVLLCRWRAIIVQCSNGLWL